MRRTKTPMMAFLGRKASEAIRKSDPKWMDTGDDAT